MNTAMKTAAFLIAMAISGIANAKPPPVELRIVCTVPTRWDPQACWVEFGQAVAGPRVEVASQAEAEELVAILLENSGRRYVFDDGVPPMSLPLPATLQLKRPPIKRGSADKR